MLQLLDISLKRGGKQLFDHFDLTIHPGWRVGIVGRNGCGKSTLFTIVRGRLLPEDGDVKLPRAWRIAHMAQETEASSRSALDWVLDGDKALRKAQRAITAAEEADQHEQLGELWHTLDTVDGHTAEARAGEILYGLGFEASDVQRPVHDFSGGWRIRLNLAQTLMAPSDLLLLDEPTNHLDLDATLWLETWLKKHQGTLLLISHDRDFLDRTATHIVHMERQQCRVWRGGYSEFERQRAEQLARDESLYKRNQSKAADLQKFVDRFRYTASKAKQAQSRLKMLERLNLAAPAHSDNPYHFSFPNPARMSNPLLQVHHGATGYDGNPVLTDLEVRVYPGSRIGLLGRNGAGKSTLLRTIAGELPLLMGERLPGEHCRIAYFHQQTSDSLNLSATPMALLEKALQASTGERKREQELRDWLGGWGFSGVMVGRQISSFSGGEKARLALALLAAQKPALLLLDEPTNHLDMEMRQALMEALQDYEGAMVVVSHDRHLLAHTVDEFWLVADGGMRPWTDDLDSYAQWLLGRGQQASAGVTEQPAAVAEASAPVPAKAKAAAPNVDRKTQRQAAARLRQQSQPMRNELKNLDRQMERLQRKLKELDTALADPALYDADQRDHAIELGIQQGRLRTELDAAEARWLDLSEQLEALDAASD